MKTMRDVLHALLVLLLAVAPVRAQDEPDEPPDPPAAIPDGAEVLARRGAIVHVPDGPPIPRGTRLRQRRSASRSTPGARWAAVTEDGWISAATRRSSLCFWRSIRWRV